MAGGDGAETEIEAFGGRRTVLEQTLSEMTSGFDEFTARAYPDYAGGTTRQRHCREVLRRAMEAEGFTVYEHEWWHFDFASWQSFPVSNEPL